MKIGVVILNYNGEKHLKTFLPKVIANSPEAEIVVADNGSTDGSLAYLSKFGSQIKIIKLDKNYGFAEGYNQALKRYTSKYYILLNSDIEVSKNWIMPLVLELEKDKTVAACQPKILSHQNINRFEHAGAAGGWMDYLGYPFCRGRVFFQTEEDQAQYNNTEEIFWASGAALCIRAELFHNIGGFDGDYFAHMEEIDLCWRLKRAGFKIKAVGNSVIYHVGGGTLDYQSTFKSYLNFRNSLFTYLKNEPSSKLWWFIPLRMMLDGLAAMMYILKGEFRFIPTILKAHFSFYTNIFYTLKKRKKYNELIENQRIAPFNETGILKKSIVWAYFLQKKKTFQEITT